ATRGHPAAACSGRASPWDLLGSSGIIRNDGDPRRNHGFRARRSAPIDGQLLPPPAQAGPRATAAFTAEVRSIERFDPTPAVALRVRVEARCAGPPDA